MATGKTLAVGAVALASYAAFKSARGTTSVPGIPPIKHVSPDADVLHAGLRHGSVFRESHHSYLHRDEPLSPSEGEPNHESDILPAIDLRFVFLAGCAAILYLSR